MDWRVRPDNITSAADFWALWDADQDAFAAIGLTLGAERSGVAALALLAWDIVATMDDEVNLMWPSAWTLPKALYLFVRYYSLIALIIHAADISGALPCVPWLIFEIMSALMVEAAVQVIMILRIYAIYGAQQKILRIMVVGFAIELVLMTVSFGVSVPHFVTGFYCKAADIPVMMVVYSTASIVYETFLFGLMIVGVLRSGKDGLADDTLLDILVRDGTAAFLGVFVAMLLNTILFAMAPTTLVTVGFPWLLSILGAMGARLILNLRAEHAQNRADRSTIEFNVPKHFYSALNIDDTPAHRARISIDSPSSSSSASHLDAEDITSPETDDREDAALNPSRSGTRSRSNTASTSKRQSTASTVRRYSNTPGPSTSTTRAERRRTQSSSRSYVIAFPRAQSLLPAARDRDRYGHTRIPSEDVDVEAGYGGGVCDSPVARTPRDGPPR